MENGTKSAKAIGALFLITMILGMIDAYLVAPTLKTPVSNIQLVETRIFVGAFSILFMSLGVVGIAILFYPVLEEHNKFVALAYVCSRVMECLLLIVGVIVYFLLLDLGSASDNVVPRNESLFHPLWKLAVEARYVGYQIAMIILGIASVMLCYVLYRARLIPRPISLVGLVGYAFVLISAPLDLMGIIDTTAEGGMMYVPGAVFELFLLPFWLMTRGFNSPQTFPAS